MELTNLDMRAYSLYCEIEGYDKIKKSYNTLMSLDTFIFRNKEYYYNLAKKELRKEKLNELQRINIH